MFVLAVLLLTTSLGYAKKSKKKQPRSRRDATESSKDAASFGITMPPQSGSTADRVIKTAFTQIGRRYRYGGSSPETGFDCQGFVMWTFGQNGVKLPRSSGEQLGHGQHVGRDDLRPGDIVIFRQSIGSARGTHSGIYLGNGKYIHSPRTGDSIRVDNAFDDNHGARYLGARRVLHDPRGVPPETLVAVAEPLATAPDADGADDAAESRAASKKERGKAATLAAQAGAKSHVIKPGDSYATLVKQYHVPLEKLLAANKLNGRERLRRGQTLVIPAVGPATQVAKAEQPGKLTGGQPLVHVVKSGDFPSSIAQKYGVKTQDIFEANKLTPRSTLQIGQKLTIPASGAPRPGVALAQLPPPTQPQARKLDAAPAPAKPVAVVAQAPAQPEAKPKDNNWRLTGLPQQSETQAPPQAKTEPAPAADKPDPAASQPAPTSTSAPVQLYASGPSPQAAGEAKAHVVQSGDSIGAIAKKYGLKTQDVLDANKLNDKSMLRLGQKILLPGPSASPATQAAAPAPAATSEPVRLAVSAKPPLHSGREANVHVVQSGDSVGAIANKYGIKAQDLLDANKLTGKSMLQLGQKILLPTTPAAPATPKTVAIAESKPAAEAPAKAASTPGIQATHTVQSGDNYSTIAHKYGLKSQALLDANKLAPSHTLRIGEKLVVPKVTETNAYNSQKKSEKKPAEARPSETDKSKKNRKIAPLHDEE